MQKEAFKERHGISLGITSLFVKAAVAALKMFPRLNAEIQGEEMVVKHYYDIGIAVGTSGGLVVPVIREDAGLMACAQESFGRLDQDTLSMLSMVTRRPGTLVGDP